MSEFRYQPIELSVDNVTVLVHLNEDPPRIHLLTGNRKAPVAVFVDGVHVAGPVTGEEDFALQVALDANPDLKAELISRWESRDRVPRPPRPVIDTSRVGRINGRE